MKMVKCDACGQLAEAHELYGNPPKDWITARRVAEQDLHYCGEKCMISDLHVRTQRERVQQYREVAGV